MNHNTEASPGRIEPAQHAPRVLVVEDDVLVRAAAAQYLRGCGFSVLEAVNVEEALDILRADRLIRVVFTDVKLPGPRNGLDLMGLVQAEFPEVKVLLTSGVSPYPDPLNGVMLLKKPYFLFEVERHIRLLLTPPNGRGRPF
jgi:CheY-like chemotaxis protein